MSKEQFDIKEIEELIIANKLVEATQKMKKLFEAYEEEDLINQAVLTLSRLDNFTRKSDQGILDNDSTEFEKIRVAVLNMKSSFKVVLKPEAAKINKVKTPAEVIFEEHFVDNSKGWLIHQKDKLNSYIKNGRYFLENNNLANSWYVTRQTEIDTTKNFTIKARMTFLKGIETKGYGLSWGCADSDNHFHFFVSANGQFFIGYKIEGEKFIINKWVNHPIIKKGKGVNSLEIKKHSDLLHFKVNGEIVHSSEFISFFGNRVGFALGEETKVAVDFFQIIN